MNTLLINASKFSALSVMLCGFLISGQVFAAWGNDSPWSKKHAEQKRQAVLEEVVLDAPVVQPVVSHIAKPIPAAAKAQSVLIPSEIVPVLETVLMPEPVFMDYSESAGILSLPGTHFAVQVYASSSTVNMDKYKVDNGLEDLTAVKTDRNGAPIYVLISLHEDRVSADEAASNLEQIIGNKPWVRSVESLQAVVMH